MLYEAKFSGFDGGVAASAGLALSSAVCRICAAFSRLRPVWRSEA
jgi:hypothetical protein